MNLPAHHQWPASLHASVAVDNLAQDLYRRHKEYYGLEVKPWLNIDTKGVPYHIRSGYVELAKRILDGLQPDSEREPESRLFVFATELGRAVTRLASRIVGRISPEAPWGEAS